ncbi:MAG: galactokinase [Chloroflexi bacterium]|nr:galactokinase [Chloroflexota bacterium]
MGATQLYQQVREAFEQRFPGEPPRIFQAPGRVNLIGEHTDYNDGFVLPVAIDRQVVLAARLREDRRVRLWATHFQQGSEFSLDQIVPDASAPWSNYVRGVALMLQQEGFALRGMDAVIAGNVPIGSGLSSSAAIEVATAVAFRDLCHLDIAPVALALLCQRAENEFVGMKCGIMDQFIAVLGQRHHALLIDCRSLDYELVPLPEGVSIVVCDTMKRRGLVDSEYNARRQECEQGVTILREYLPDVKALRDVTSQDLARYGHLLPPVVRKRCAHVVSENERTLQAVAALRAGQVEEFGRLMDQSHVSLRDDYEVSCQELDCMVELARVAPGCLGARMTGAGFGGCTVNLVQTEATEAFTQRVADEYQREMGVKPEIYVCEASAGAGSLSPNPSF